MSPITVLYVLAFYASDPLSDSTDARFLVRALGITKWREFTRPVNSRLFALTGETLGAAPTLGRLREIGRLLIVEGVFDDVLVPASAFAVLDELEAPEIARESIAQAPTPEEDLDESIDEYLERMIDRAFASVA